MNKGPESRIRVQISTNGLERRWKAVRQAMKERGLDFLIFQSSVVSLPGYIKWFTDMPAGGYPATVIFPLESAFSIITATRLSF